jgi:hypothetical protein
VLSISPQCLHLIATARISSTQLDGPRGSRVQWYGSRTRKDGLEVRRYECFFNGARHAFSEC